VKSTTEIESELERLGRVRGWYRLAFGLAVAVSLAANWLSAEATMGARAFSLIAPIALLVVVEMLLQPRPRVERSAVESVALAVIPLAIALFAAVVSFGHIREVAIYFGQPEWAATLLPLVIDLLAVVANMLSREAHRATAIHQAELVEAKATAREAEQVAEAEAIAEVEALAEAERLEGIEAVAKAAEAERRAAQRKRTAAKSGDAKAKAKAFRLHKDGLTQPEIAAKLGKSTRTIRRWLNDTGASTLEVAA